MNIDFNECYQLQTELTKIEHLDLYQLTLTKVDTTDGASIVTNKDEHYFTFDELKQFVTYLNKATNGYI
jgi:hypothetical protein